MADGLPNVVQSGNRRASLEAIRDHLAAQLNGAEGRDIAPLAKELRNVIDAIDAIPTPREESVVDQLADEVAAQRNKRKPGRAANS